MKKIVTFFLALLILPVSANATEVDLEKWYNAGREISRRREEARRGDVGIQIASGIDRAVNNIRNIRERRIQEQRETELYNSLEDRSDQINRAVARGELTQAEAEEKIYATKMRHFELWQQKTTDAERTQAMKEQANAMNKQARAIENAASKQVQAARSSGGDDNNLSLSGVHCTTRTDGLGNTSYIDCY